MGRDSQVQSGKQFQAEKLPSAKISKLKKDCGVQCDIQQAGGWGGVFFFSFNFFLSLITEYQHFFFTVILVP